MQADEEVFCEAKTRSGAFERSRAGVYVLRLYPSKPKDGSYYTGFTSDLNGRINQHNSGQVEYSSTKRPFELIWHCCFKNKIQAIQFEKYLKSGSGFAFARKRLV